MLKGVSKTQLVLMVLASSPNKCISLNELREKTGIDKKLLAVYINRYKKKGVIETKIIKDEKGKREIIYCLKMN